MARIFIIEDVSGIHVTNVEGFKGYIVTGVLHNSDIGEFHVTEIDFKLNLERAVKLATKLGYAACFCANYTSSNDVESSFKNMLKMTGKLKGIC